MNTDQRHKTATSRASDAARVLARLRQGPATAPELAAVCFSYRQRTSDLRADGWLIECKRTAAGSVFRLAGHREAGQLTLRVA